MHGHVIIKQAATSDQPNSQGATDADVPEEEGRSKARARELFAS